MKAIPVGPFYMAQFEIENFLDKRFECYTNETTWNGWECPFFTKASADKLLAACEAQGVKASYDEQTDTYTFNVDDQDDEDDQYQGFDIVVDGQPVRVYWIGNHSYCWMEIEPVYKKTRFGIEDCFDGKSFAGYTALGEHWDGWMCPYFTKETADELMTADVHTVAKYVPETDTYDFGSGEIVDNPANHTFCKGMDIEVDGQTIHVYPIGTGSWCWVERHPPIEVNVRATDAGHGLTSWVATMGDDPSQVLAYGFIQSIERGVVWHGNFYDRNGAEGRAHLAETNQDAALDAIRDEIQCTWRRM